MIVVNLRTNQSKKTIEIILPHYSHYAYSYFPTTNNKSVIYLVILQFYGSETSYGSYGETSSAPATVAYWEAQPAQVAHQ